VHPVLEALDGRSRQIERVLVARERGGPRLGRVLKRAREAGVPVTRLPRRALDRKAGSGASHQGVAAVVSAARYADTELFLTEMLAKEEALLVALDRVQDPRNLGAILRTAAAAGTDGVILGGDGSVGLTATVAKTAAGCLSILPVVRVTRLATTLRRLCSDGQFRMLALDPDSDQPWDRAELVGRVVVVAGGEGSGLRRGVLDACDSRISVPMAHGVPSLNVSVCVGVVLFEALRQRRAAKMTGFGSSSGESP
jgi:23S rRNA (guanosine2251-2'-O)-methyltransferase